MRLLVEPTFRKKTMVLLEEWTSASLTVTERRKNGAEYFDLLRSASFCISVESPPDLLQIQKCKELKTHANIMTHSVYTKTVNKFISPELIKAIAEMYFLCFKRFSLYVTYNK